LREQYRQAMTGVYQVVRVQQQGEVVPPYLLDQA